MNDEFKLLLGAAVTVIVMILSANACHPSNQDTALAQQLDQPSLSPTVGLHIADIQWERITCRTDQIGNFAPLVDCDTLIVIQPHAILRTQLEPKPQVWTEQLEPPAQGMKVTKIVRWIKRSK